MAELMIRVCDMCPEDDEVRADGTPVQWQDGEHLLELDLCEEHKQQHQKFLVELQRWRGPARATTPPPAPRRRGNSRSLAERQENAAIRAWATQRGTEMPERGRIPAELREQWRSEQGRQAEVRWNAAASGG